MMKSSTLLFLCLFALCSFGAEAQRSQRKVKFKPSEVSKMPVVLIDMIEKSYPKAHLQSVSNSSLTIIKKTLHEHTLEPMYFSGVVPLDEIESIVLVSKKRRFKTNIIGAAVGGALGYFIGRQFRPDPLRQPNIELANQRPVNGFIEPILGGIVGVGFGTIIGDLFTPLYIDNVNRNQREAIAKLKEHTVNPRKKSKKRRR